MKKILTFLAITFILTWALWSPVVFNVGDINTSGMGTLIVSLGMFCPLIGALVTKLIFRKSEKIDLKMRPKIKGNIKYYLLGWFIPAVFTLVGAIIYFLIYRYQFSVFNGYFAQLIPAGQISSEMIPVMLLAQTAFALFLAPFINMIFAFGEEAGWRGFLVPALREKMADWKVILLSGVIWGLWHAPITVAGHNYGIGYPGYPFTGILAMCIFCISFGAFLTYITIKSDSIWPAALSHGALNAISGLPLYFMADLTSANRVLGPTIAGVVAGIPVIIGGVICIWKLKGNKISQAGE